MRDEEIPSHRAVVVQRDKVTLKAIASYYGHVSWVLTKVADMGVENVCRYAKHEWIRSLYLAIMEFSEKSIIKMIPQELQGTGENGAIAIEVRKVDASEFENNVQAPRFAVPSLQ